MNPNVNTIDGLREPHSQGTCMWQYHITLLSFITAANTTHYRQDPLPHTSATDL